MGKSTGYGMTDGDHLCYVKVRDVIEVFKKRSSFMVFSDQQKLCQCAVVYTMLITASVKINLIAPNE